VSPVIVAVVLLAILYGFLNGFNDGSNIAATMISSRSMSPRAARGLTAAAELLGPFILGIAVARTIGLDIVDAKVISSRVILAALISAIFWNSLTSYIGFPNSTSHALVGGLIGSVVISAGWAAIHVSGLEKILIPLFISPVIGLGIGFIVLRVLVRLSWNASPYINRFFKRSQILTIIALGLSHGSNDAPKAMGMVTLALITEGYLKTFTVPIWVILLSAMALAAGAAVGGRRLIRTMGGKFYKIDPLDAFASQLASALVIVTASLTGGPVSATQVVSSAVMGVGAGERPNKVRWGIAQDIVTTWFLTIPVTALIAAGVYWLLVRRLQ
jgi:PiT family inorganic phosphate transporter